jgi:hypothetical protein
MVATNTPLHEEEGPGVRAISGSSGQSTKAERPIKAITTMSEYNIKRNLNALTAMAANLTPYLYEDELFGHLGNNLPKLTVGGLLMRIHQLKALEQQDALTPHQQEELHNAILNWEAARSEWALHYEQKILRELESRMGALRWYLDDCSREPASCRANWPNECEKRTIIAHLIREAATLDILKDDLRNDLAMLDARLRGLHRRGAFLWDTVLETAYPPEEFWWLYGVAEGRDD